MGFFPQNQVAILFVTWIETESDRDRYLQNERERERVVEREMYANTFTSIYQYVGVCYVLVGFTYTECCCCYIHTNTHTHTQRENVVGVFFLCRMLQDVNFNWFGFCLINFVWHLISYLHIPNVNMHTYRWHAKGRTRTRAGM